MTFAKTIGKLLKMNLNKLFDDQINQGASMLYFVLKEGEFECLQRYKIEEKSSVIDLLKNCKYLDTKIGIPRFEKKAKKNASNTA